MLSKCQCSPLLRAVSSERTEVESVWCCLEKYLVRVGQWCVGKVGGQRDAPPEWVVRALGIGETVCMGPETRFCGLAVVDRGNC